MPTICCATGARPLSDIRQAASLVVVRDRAARLEVLMVTRSAALTFAGGALVFPGGALDPADSAAAARHADPEDCAHRLAAIREAREEVGLTMAVERLVPLSRWLPPLHIPRRFDTRFYLTALEGDPPLTPDGMEVVAAQWIRPQAALTHPACACCSRPACTCTGWHSTRRRRRRWHIRSHTRRGRFRPLWPSATEPSTCASRTTSVSRSPPCRSHSPTGAERSLRSRRVWPIYCPYRAWVVGHFEILPLP
ncbi:NUDIX domain-containing protein [Hankyongella ginsenosidimutans]|uniref:NUDIX domain-containing protein n=1 Tax=Hankyongella ginsenosidimutans TaxID=1763828 RepID=A0A4D7C7R6_9SPHN|nr:NUDIX domain-containing protein [Hankyongella ginsenosidimutans]